MDKIKILQSKSIYEIYDEPFKDIYINGVSINILLDKEFPDCNIKGLVPPFDNWLINDNDYAILWERIIPKENESTYLPILICPDDQDYSCTVIVTEVTSLKNVITWSKFGIDDSYVFNKPELIGTKIDFFEKEIEYTFDKTEYVEAMNLLRKVRNTAPNSKYKRSR